jgi:glucose/arabinose dehydrogenase
VRRVGVALGVVVAVVTGAAFAANAVAARAQSSPANLTSARVELKQVATGLDSPVALAWRSGDASHIYVAEQSGTLVIVSNGHIAGTVLHVSVSHGDEQGLLGVVFSKDGSKLYVYYTDPTGDIHVVEYTMKGDVANVATRRQLLLIPHHIFPNHDGGSLVMGPDNMLYIGVGDGGGGGDTLHNSQNKDVLLGKILRIDPRKHGSSPYTIPSGNPFVGKAGTRPEIWMYGLRNPWRFSFDKTTHALWIGDVGQDLYEEIDYAPAGQKGINWGWPLREGFHPYNGGAKPPGARDPILERPHSAGDCAIIGGFVYRGTAIASFNGAYVFGDECTGELRAVTQKGGKVAQSRDLKLNVAQLTTFGESPTGAILAVSREGTIYQLAQG